MKGIRGWLLGCLGFAALGIPVPASAHPELILYIDTATTFHSEDQQLFLDYYISKSEQFSFSELAEAGSDLELYARSECERSENGIKLATGEYQIPIELKSAVAIERLASTGAGVWVDCKFVSPIEFYGDVTFTWEDQNFSQTPGYREFNTSLAISPSNNLTDFSEVRELIRETTGEFSFNFPDEALPEEPDVIADVAPKVKKPKLQDSVINKVEVTPVMVEGKEVEKSILTELSDRYFRTISPNLLTVLIGTALALLLGALHSIAPGHGKSIMAVLALGDRGGRREIVRLGVTMGITHTAGVFILGSIFIFGSAYVPTTTIPILGIISGVLVIAIGSFYLQKHLSHRRVHKSGHEHHHHKGVGGQRIALLGVVGGMVPTPTALTVLIGTAALGSPWYGILLVGSYGVGMTVILIFAGRLAENLYGAMETAAKGSRGTKVFFDLVPIIAASIQVLAGLFLVVISYGAIG